jgi:ribosomal protein S21
MQEKNKFYKKVKDNEMSVPGSFTAVKVVSGQIEQALRLFKKKVMESGKLERAKELTKYEKPSVVKRRNMEAAKLKNEYLKKKR